MVANGFDVLKEIVILKFFDVLIVIVQFIAVANIAIGTISPKAELLSLTETVAADYNGTFVDVSIKCRRSGVS